MRRRFLRCLAGLLAALAVSAFAVAGAAAAEVAGDSGGSARWVFAPATLGFAQSLRQPVQAWHDSSPLMVWSDWLSDKEENLYSSTQAYPWAPWSSPVLLDTKVANGTLRMQTGAGGLTALAWLRLDGEGYESIRVKVMMPSSSVWTTVTPAFTRESPVKPGHGVQDLRLWVSPSGIVSVGWINGMDGEMCERSWDPVSTSWSPRRTIAERSAGVLFDLTGGLDGELTAGWNNASENLVSSLRPGGTQWSAPTNLEPGGWTFAVFPYTLVVKTNEAGTSLAAWSEYRAEYGNQLMTSTRLAKSESWSSPAVLATTDDADFNYDPKIALGANQGFLLVAGSRLATDTRAIVAYDIDATGRALTTTTVLGNGLRSEAFELAGNTGGRAAVVVDRGERDYGRTTSLWVLHRMAAGLGWSEPQLLSASAQKTENDSGGMMRAGGYTSPSLLISPEGDIMAAWRDAVAVRSATLTARVQPAFAPRIAWTPTGSRTIRRANGRARYTVAARFSGPYGPLARMKVVLQARISTHTAWQDKYVLTTDDAGRVGKTVTATRKSTTYYRWAVPASHPVSSTVSSVQKVSIR